MNAQQTDMSKPKPEDKCFLCGKAGHWKKIVQTQEISPAIVLSINRLNDAEKEEFAEASF